MRKELISLSKFISLILRNNPSIIGITLDEHGWASVPELLAGIAKTRPITMELLEEIVATNSKQRFSFNEGKNLIRANQGHSIPVDVELNVMEPPQFLYHGTAAKYTASIEKEGLKPQGRLHVHLSEDRDTAFRVGQRHGKPVIYKIQSGEMYREGYIFFRSVNGVWLIDAVPVQYLNAE